MKDNGPTRKRSGRSFLGFRRAVVPTRERAPGGGSEPDARPYAAIIGTTLSVDVGSLPAIHISSAAASIGRQKR